MSSERNRLRPRGGYRRPYGNPSPGEAPAAARPRGGKRILVGLGLAIGAAVLAYTAYSPKRPVAPAPTPPGAEASAPRPVPKAPPAPVSGPRIQFASKVHDFGKAIGDDMVDCLFVFTNTGTAPLKLSTVSPGCSCMKAGAWTTNEVPPGQTGQVPIRYDSRHYTGAFAKSTFVTCNDPAEQNVILEIKGYVWRPIEVTPLHAVLNLSSETPSNATSVRLLNHTEQPLTLFEVASSTRALAVEVQTNTPGQEYELKIHTTHPWPTHNQHGQITLKTSATNAPFLSIPANINFQPERCRRKPRMNTNEHE